MQKTTKAGRCAGPALALAAALACADIATAHAQIFMSPTQEKETGTAEHQKIVPQFGGVYEAKGLGAYVARVGQRAAEKSDDPGIGYTVTLLNSPVVNAFALPGGYVYVTRGLLALANSEAELAGVLGHEIGHVTEHHTAKRYDRAVGTSILGAVLGAVTGSQIVGGLANLGGQAYLAGFSRSQEYQSDLIGVRILARAGYDPYAQSDFLATLGREETLTSKLSGLERSRMQFFATHPNTGDRVQRAAEEAGKQGDRGQPRKRDEYLTQIDGMIYGDDPKEGFIRGRTFAHPGLRFQFDVPDGFALQNSSAQVVAQAQDGSTVIFDGRGVEPGTAPERHLVTGFAQELKVRPQNIQTFDVNGMAAAAGVTRAQTNQGVVDVKLVAIRFTNEEMYRFLFISPPERTESVSGAFQGTVKSFRRLSAAEAAALKPLRMRIVTAAPGDSVQSLAARMAFADHQEERFRVLNGIGASDGVSAGQRYKIIQ